MRKPLIPTSALALRLCDIFHRKHETPWSQKEVRAFRLFKSAIDEDDLVMIERTYKRQWPPMREKNILRHDLYTFINNYSTEVDRARIYCESHPIKVIRKIIPLPQIEREPFVESMGPNEIMALDRFNEERKLRKATKAL